MSARDSFTAEALSTSFHAFWSLWTGQDGYELPVDLWYKKLPSLTPQYMPLEGPLLVAYWPLRRQRLSQALSPRPLILTCPYVLGHGSSTPQVQHNHRTFLLENRVKGRCCGISHLWKGYLLHPQYLDRCHGFRGKLCPQSLGHCVILEYNCVDSKASSYTL